MEEKRRIKLYLTRFRSQQLSRWRAVKNKKKQSDAYNKVIHIDMYRKLQSLVDK